MIVLGLFDSSKVLLEAAISQTKGDVGGDILLRTAHLAQNG